MKNLLTILAVLLLAGGIGIGTAWYVRPELGLEPVEGPGFDPDNPNPPRSIGTQALTPVVASQGGASGPEALAHERRALRNNAALEALEGGDLEFALQALRACFDEEPENTTFRRNLIEVMARLARGLWSQGDRQQAIWKLEEALELAEPLEPPDDRPDLVQLLERWQREFGVEADFWQDTSQHFELSYDASHQDLLHGYQDVIDLLEAAYADLRDVFGHDPVFERDRRYRVVLYRRERFQEVTGLHAWAGGAFDGTVRVPVADLNKELAGLDPLLRHELVHAFVEAVGGNSVPGWFNEGLAQYLSGERATAIGRAETAMQDGFFTLDELGGSFAGWSDRTKVSRAYTQSLLLVDAIASRYGERLLAELCADAKGGPGVDGAALPEGAAGIVDGFAARTGWDLGELLAELAASYAER